MVALGHVNFYHDKKAGVVLEPIFAQHTILAELPKLAW